MPFGLENLSPQQRKIALYGLPVVAAIALGTKLAKPKVVAPADTTAKTSGFVMPSTSAIDVGQLSAFESSLTGALIGVQKQLDDLVNKGTTTPPTPNPVPVPQPWPGWRPTPQPAPRPIVPVVVYTIKAGDTMATIAANARSYFGGSTTAAQIYSLNASAIEGAAHAHGRASSEGGRWLYPGTQLVIP